MSLKFKVARLEDVPEAYRSLYQADGNGSFILAVEGAVDKGRLDEFRTTNIQLQQQIDRFKGIDPAKHAELLELQRELNEGQLLKAGKIDEVVNGRVAAMRQSLETERDGFKTRADKAEAQLQGLLIDAAARNAGMAQGLLPTAAEDLVFRARAVFKMVDGAPVPHDDKGVVYGKDGKSPMTVNEWVTGLKATASHLFQGSTGGGAAGGNVPGRVDMSKASPLDKINMGLAQGAGMRPEGS